MMSKDPEDLWKQPGPMDFSTFGSSKPHDDCSCGQKGTCDKCKRDDNEHPKHHDDCSCGHKGVCDKCKQIANGECDAILDQEICVEAKVTVSPKVEIGRVKIECVESRIERSPRIKKMGSQEECTLFVNQTIRVKVPIKFIAKVDAHKTGVICNVCNIEGCNCEKHLKRPDC